MDVTVLSVPDCPNVSLLEQRLEQVLDGRSGVTVTHLVIADEEEAVRVGMHGSPTLLVDGTDPFAEPDMPASVSCRLYPGGDGPGGGVPSVRALREALQPALREALRPALREALQPAPNPGDDAAQSRLQATARRTSPDVSEPPPA
jgi:hypothetical protein